MTQPGLLSYRAILNVTLPVMLGLFIQFGVTVTDSAFLSRVSGTAYSAAGNGGLLFMTFVMICYGIAGAAQILVARREGEGSFGRVGIVFRKAVASIGVFAVLTVLFFYFGSSWITSWSVQDSAIATDMQTYLQIRSLGMIFFPLSMAYNGLYMGVGRTKVITVAMLMQGISNIALDYAWVLGGWGFEPMGIYGAALATAISDGVAMVTYMIWSALDQKNKKYSLWNGGWHDEKSAGLLNLSWPLIAQGMLAVGAWTVFFFLIEHLGKDEIEISQNIRNVYFLCLISVMGFGTATRTFISQMLAREEYELVTVNLRRIIILCTAFTSIAVGMFLFMPEMLISLVNKNEKILPDTVFVLRLVSISMILFSISSPMHNLVAGAGDTRMAMFIEGATIGVYLTLTAVITLVYPQPVWVVWCMEYVYFSLLFFLALRYIQSGKWKHFQI